MAARNPLVIIQGQVQELPAGDTVVGGGSAGNWPTVKASVGIGETCTIAAEYQLILAHGIANSGTLANSGELYII